jgi:phosphoribosylformylglycinamidine synthase
VLGLIREGVVKSAHDCSEGGLAVALAESTFSQLVAKNTPRFLGATIDLSALKSARLDGLLFGETQNRIVVTVSPANAGRVLKQAAAVGVPAARLGVVGGNDLVVKTASGEFRSPLPALHDGWWNSIARAMA